MEPVHARGGLRIAYAQFGEQSGVADHVTEALEARGHRVIPVFGRGPLELRNRLTGLPRLTAPVVLHLAAAAARFGSQTLAYRWNTPYAFEVHSRWVGELVAGLPLAPDVVLQNGALFSPGRPPPYPYVIYLDQTRALAERARAHPSAGLPAPPRWGEDWRQHEGAAYREAAAVVAFSRRAARSVVEDYGVDLGRVHVVGAGANVVPDEVERHDDGNTILFIGREFERKGGRVLLDAFARLRQTRPGVRLLIVGPRRLEVMPHGVLQLGPEPLAAIPGLLAQATVFTLPTLAEPFGLAFLDAMACAVPCVGTEVDSVPDIIEHGRTGLLVPPGDAAALARALGALLVDRDRAREMGARGRERVMAHFTWGRVARRLAEVLRSAALPVRTESSRPARSRSVPDERSAVPDKRSGFSTRAQFPLERGEGVAGRG